MRVPLSRHLGMEALALPVPPTPAGAFHCGFTSAAILPPPPRSNNNGGLSGFFWSAGMPGAGLSDPF